jgi:endonuclease III
VDNETFARLTYDRLLKKFGSPVWREPLPPLDEAISTILSQNTNDTNRDRAFQSLKSHFLDWEAVRDADTQDVINAIRSAGLANQKGARIQSFLREISEKAPAGTIKDSLNLDFLRSFTVEEARSWLMQFKGIGPKTAAIVLQFSLGLPAFPVDTHIYRVTGRLGLRPKAMTVEETHPYLESIFPPDYYYIAHLNIIRLGREICNARRPACTLCPLQDVCDYVKNG